MTDGTITQSTQNRISTSNYLTSSLLNEGASIQGEWESCHRFSWISLYVKTTTIDKIGWLYVEFSRNKSDVTQKLGFRVMDNEFNKQLKCPVQNAYFRVTFTASNVLDQRTNPGNNNISDLEIHCMMHTENPKAIFEIGKQKVKMDGFDVSSGTKIPAFGLSLTMDNYPLPTSNQYVRIVNTSNDNGDYMSGGAAGMYLRTVLLIGVNDQLDEVYLKMSVNPANVSSGTVTSSTQCMIRVNEFKMLTYGTAGKPYAYGSVTVQIYDGPCKSVISRYPNWGFKESTPVYYLPRNYGYGRITAVNYTGTNLAAQIYIHLNRSVGGTTTTLRHSEWIFNFMYLSCNPMHYPDGVVTSYGKPGDFYNVQFYAGTSVGINAEVEIECG